MPQAKPLFPAIVAALTLGTPCADANGTDGEAVTFDSEYQFYLGGLRIADARLSGSLGILSYSIETSLETRGMFHTLRMQALMTAKAEGRNKGRGKLSPTRYRSEYTTDGEAGTLSITYDGRTPAVAAVPPIVPTAYQAPRTHMADTLDPLSALLTAMRTDGAEEICNRTLPVFDGTRRYDIHLLPADRHPAPKAFKPLKREDPVKRCFGVYDRLSGFDEPADAGKQVGKRYYPFDIWFEVSPTGIHRIARIAGRTSLGYIVGLRRP